MVNFFQISEGDLPKAWYAGNLYGLGILKLHCPKKNLNFRLQTEPAMVGAESTVYVWCLGQIYYECQQKPDVYRSSRVTGLAFKLRFRLIFWTVCTVHELTLYGPHGLSWPPFVMKCYHFLTLKSGFPSPSAKEYILVRERTAKWVFYENA